MLMMSPFCSTRPDGARVAENHRRVRHRGRADDEKVDVAAALEDGGAGRRAQLVLLHPGTRPRHHRVHRVAAQPARRAHAIELLRAVDRQQLVQEALGEHQLGLGQILAQHVVLVDRQVIPVPRVDLHQADAAALEFQFADALDHDVGVAAAAAVAHVLDRDLDLPAYRLGVGAAHGIDQRGLALERNQHVARERVPFPVPGQPQHAAAEAPVAGAAGNDEGVEPVRAHFPAQRAIAALVFGRRELLPHGVAVIGRIAHVGEGQRLIELSPHLLPWLRADLRRSDVHGRDSWRVT
jgi:hypothetical protein